MYHLVILQLTKEKEFCFKLNFLFSFAVLKMVVVAQLVRASDCDSEGRGFEPHHPPKKVLLKSGIFDVKIFFPLRLRSYLMKAVHTFYKTFVNSVTYF